jgi:hypothetical protein
MVRCRVISSTMQRASLVRAYLTDQAMGFCGLGCFVCGDLLFSGLAVMLDSTRSPKATLIERLTRSYLQAQIPDPQPWRSYSVADLRELLHQFERPGSGPFRRNWATVETFPNAFTWLRGKVEYILPEIHGATAASSVLSSLALLLCRVCGGRSGHGALFAWCTRGESRAG